MELSHQAQDEIALFLTEEIYSSYLQHINQIPFTNREIDIISCLLGGRTTKKIAPLLNIAPKTVDNHVRNVMLKLNCTSREQIVEFVERSDKFSFIKKYYLNLLIQSNFELELKKFSGTNPIKKSLAILPYYADANHKSNLFDKIVKNFTLVGINTIILKEHIHLDFLKNKIATHKINSLLFCIFQNQIQNQTTNAKVADDTFNKIVELMLYIQNEKTQRINLILLLNNYSLEKYSESLCHFKTINIDEYQNYHSLFIDVLQLISPEISCTDNLTTFNKFYQNLLDHHVNKNGMKQSIESQMSQMSNSLTRPNRAIKFFLDKSFITNKLWPTKKRVAWFSGILAVSILIFPLIKTFITNQQTIFENSISKSLLSSPHDLIVNQIENGEPVYWNLPRQDQIFIGREELLSSLNNKFKGKAKHNILPTKHLSQNTAQRLTIAACAGLGGIGKTQLALQYAYHSNYPYKLKAWFQAENIDQLRQQHIEFAKALGYAEKKITFEDAIFYVKNWLTKHSDWLLIYDNANAYDEIASFLPEGDGHIIITSRNRSWPDNFEVLPIDVMMEEESIHLIKSLIHHPIKEDEIENLRSLVKLLGYLPLALAQAGAYIRQNQISISEYLELYKDHEAELLADNTIPEGHHHIPVAITWNISLSSLAKNSNNDVSVIDLLTVCAYLSPENIPRNLLLAYLKEAYPNLISHELALSKVIGQLWRYSLINSPEEGNINIHRLLQVVLRSRHQELLTDKINNYNKLTPEWYNLLMTSTYNEFRRSNENPLEDDIRRRNLIPHLHALVINHKKLWPDNESPELARILLSISYSSWLLGDLKYSIEYGESALKIFKQHYGMNHLEVAKTLSNLGYYHLETDNVKQAKKLLEASLEIHEKIHGKHHWKSASALSDLGSVYRELGKFKEAQYTLELALKLIESHHGKNSLQATSTLTALGFVYGDLNEDKKRIEVLERALKIREQFFGLNHPYLVKILRSLAQAYSDIGIFQQQKVLLERAFYICKSYYGNTHPETASTLNYLGKTYNALGDSNQAKTLLETALKTREEHYGKDHLKVAKTLDTLGKVYLDLGNANKAKEVHERALKIKIKYYGENHPKVAKTLTYLGNDYGFLGDAKKQKNLASQAFEIQEKYYGGNHIQIADTIANLGYAERALGNTEQSKKMQERALDIKIQHFGENHPEVAKTIASIGDLYGDLGDHSQKILLLKKALEIISQYYGENHPSKAKILTGIGDTYRVLGDGKQAKKTLEKALKIREQYFGENHPEVAKTLSCLGDVYLELNENKKAKAFHERTLKIREQFFGNDHPEVAKTLTALGRVYLQFKDTQKANEILQHALQIKENFYGKEHPEVAKTLRNLTSVLITAQKYKEAKLTAERCYLIYLKAYGENHKETLHSLHLIKNELKDEA